MNNKLVKTDTTWYKIKNYLRKIFKKHKFNYINDIYENEDEKIVKEKDIDKVFLNNIYIKKEIEDSNRKEELARKLLNHELKIHDLTEKEIDEMTEYFIKDIEEIDKELLRIKNHILLMKKELYDNE